jgi:mRNA-degrading endonuclease toxin of MazEF toxin-antitoxin module
MSLSAVHRGEIYYADLDPVVGSETGKNRLVLIIQNDIGNAYSPTTIVAVVTEYSDKKVRHPICVSITKDAGLEKDSIVNLACNDHRYKAGDRPPLPRHGRPGPVYDPGDCPHRAELRL